MSSTKPLGLHFNIIQQEKYSKGQAILRYCLGIFYIAIPHFFVLAFVGMASNFITFLAWWTILFTGKYPKNWFDFQVKCIKWSTRLTARLWHMADGYPAFGLSKEDPAIQIEVEYPETYSRGILLLKTFLGFFLIIPHMFCLLFRMWASLILVILTFWSILFTGTYSPSWHKFNVGTQRWMLRVQLYLSFMRDEYPPLNSREFSGNNLGDGVLDATAASLATGVAAASTSSASGESQKKTVLVRKPDGTVVKKVIDVPSEGAKESAAPASKSTSSTTAHAASTASAKAAPHKPADTSTENKPEEEKKKRNLSGVILGVLAGLFFFLMLFVGWKYQNERALHETDKSSWSLIEKEYKDEITALNEKVDNLNQESIMLRDMVDNPEKSLKGKALLAERDALQDRLSRLQSSGGGGGGSSKYKKEIEALKQKIAVLEAELEQYKSTAKQLENDKLALASDLAGQKQKADELKNTNKRMQDQIDEASLLDFEDIVAGGIKYKSETSKKDKPKVRSLNKIQVCFSIAANKIAKAGNRDIYVRIVDPNGQILSRTEQQFDLKGEQIKYSLTKSQSYSNKEELVCMYYDKNEDKFLKGNYTVEIYSEDRKVGETRFELK